MVSVGEIVVTTLFLIFAGGALFWLYVAWNFANNRQQRVVSRGANGFEGDTITLQCPSGKTISTFKAQFTCDVSGLTGTEFAGCDPFLQNGNFNPNTTQDAKEWLASQCDGKNSCDITVPSQSTSGGPGTLCPGCPKVMLIGNYDCYP